MKQAIALLSGGLDSTVAIHMTAHEAKVRLALTFDYGQKAASAEIRAASLTSRRLDIPHQVIRLPWLAEICQTALVNPKREIPTLPPDRLDDVNLTLQTAAAVWVPNRNGLFLNVAAAFAEAFQCEILVAGFNAEEGVTFPDNSPPFVDAADRFFHFSTLTHPTVVCPTLQMRKDEIVRKAIDLGIEWDQIWPCYLNQTRWCGRCESCLRLKRALEGSGRHWPC